VTHALARADLGSIDAEIEQALKHVAIALEAQLISLCAPCDGRLVARAEWRGERFMDRPFELDLGQAAWWDQRRAAGEDIVLDALAELPGEACYEREYLRSRGTVALAAIEVPGVDAALLVIEALRPRPRRWTSRELDLLDELAGAVGAALDRRNHQRRLHDALDAVTRAHAAKVEVVGRLVHEIGTPLTSILGEAQLLQIEGPLTPGQQARLRTLLGAVRHIHALMADLLELSRAEAGALKINLGPLDLGAMLRDVVAMTAARARSRGVEVALELPAAPLVVQADGKKVQQIVTNLVVNAIKFGREGGQLAIRLRDRDVDYDLEVADDGPGIDPANHDYVFQSFARLDTIERRGV
jgi:signal transduction histidine kinase